MQKWKPDMTEEEKRAWLVDEMDDDSDEQLERDRIRLRWMEFHEEELEELTDTQWIQIMHVIDRTELTFKELDRMTPKEVLALAI